MDVKNRSVHKKIESKQKRAIQYISAETNIVLGQEPTKHILICNAGLALRLSQEDVIQTFSKYGTIESVVMLPNKTYCFMSFFDKSDAISAYNALHGKCFFPRTETLMVLAFAVQVPQIPNEWAALPRETPPGMIVLEDFVTLEEEAALVQFLKWNDQEGQLKQRQVQHFGYEFRYGLNDVDDETPLENGIPPICDFLQPRLATRGHSKWNFHPDQLTVNRYLPGQGIPPHVDTHSVFEDPILSLSLLSDVVMEFRDISGRKIPVLLPQRSLAIISGESRYGWTHGIASRSHDIVCADNNKGLTLLPRQERVSFTFRCLRPKRECFCSFPGLCDSQKQNLFSQQLDAIHLEKHFVRHVYEEISDHFSETRHKPWPNIVEFCKTFRTGQILIDVGCGNGKYFGQQAENVSLYQVGIDASAHLADVCTQRGIEVMNGDCVNLPFRTGIADGVLCIAVIHHLASHERRRKAIQEIARVLCKGGRALIYVWARDQQSQDKMSTYLKQSRKNRHLKPTSSQTQEDSQNCANNPGNLSESDSNDHRSDLPLPVHINRTNFKHSDVLVPWKLKGVQKSSESNQQTFFRYYHVFEADELKELCSEVPQVQVLETKYDQGNWTVLLRKLP
ncbi:alkylated DNA repair protein alkB homolog 8 [Thrips palmi]|uniref:tRNA (carboxymethyluridine(34)-5-O)-methyltransferase n=1 Tax=Thrips palmi TaxID=161013 RepID=A0A6P8Z2D9_THRPL|nr:alkylated DNA repair protein alkB homolog 8 [Thrips palmi]